MQSSYCITLFSFIHQILLSMVPITQPFHSPNKNLTRVLKKIQGLSAPIQNSSNSTAKAFDNLFVVLTLCALGVAVIILIVVVVILRKKYLKQKRERELSKKEKGDIDLHYPSDTSVIVVTQQMGLNSDLNRQSYQLVQQRKKNGSNFPDSIIEGVEEKSFQGDRYISGGNGDRESNMDESQGKYGSLLQRGSQEIIGKDHAKNTIKVKEKKELNNYERNLMELEDVIAENHSDFDFPSIKTEELNERRDIFNNVRLQSLPQRILARNSDTRNNHKKDQKEVSAAKRQSVAQKTNPIKEKIIEEDPKSPNKLLKKAHSFNIENFPDMPISPSSFNQMLSEDDNTTIYESLAGETAFGSKMNDSVLKSIKMSKKGLPQKEKGLRRGSLRRQITQGEDDLSEYESCTWFSQDEGDEAFDRDDISFTENLGKGNLLKENASVRDELMIRGIEE